MTWPGGVSVVWVCFLGRVRRLRAPGTQRFKGFKESLQNDGCVFPKPFPGADFQVKHIEF